MAPRAAATRAPLRQDCLEELQILAKVSFREKQVWVTFDGERVSVERLIDTANRLGFHVSLKATEPNR